MSINRLFRYVTAVLLFSGLHFGAFAANANHTAVVSGTDLYQDKRDSKQEREKSSKESKKPEVKEVPQSRKQQKPSEVKQDKKEKPAKDNKKKN